MRFKNLSTALLSIPIASYCSIKRLLDKLLNSPQIPAFRMTTGIGQHSSGILSPIDKNNH